MSSRISLANAGKIGTDENFPVASWLISSEFRKHILIFYDCVRVADDIADSPALSSKEKFTLLKSIDDVLQGEGKLDDVTKFANAHVISAKETGVSVKHARHLLQAFIMDVTKKRYQNWSELINYCLYSAAPVGRYLVDLHHCPSKCKQAIDGLCIALQLLNHLQDCKQDYVNIDRVYIPEDMLKKQGIGVTALNGEHACEDLKKVFHALLDRIDRLIKQARTGVNNITPFRLRLETEVIIAIAEKLSNKLRRNDPIAGRVKLTKMQRLLCIFKGVWRGVIAG